MQELEKTELHEAATCAKSKVDNLELNLKKQRIEINAMSNKCELKQYLADETEKDKKLLQVKVETLQSKVKEMM